VEKVKLLTEFALDFSVALIRECIRSNLPPAQSLLSQIKKFLDLCPVEEIRCVPERGKYPFDN
jgi:hypothetical protein